jgi:hypothetical protein
MARFRYASNVPPSSFEMLDPPRADGLLQLVFSGQCLDGRDPQAVRRAVASALKLDEKREAHLFSGQRVVVRREVDVVAAHRYVARFALMGAVLRAEPSEPRSPRPEPVRAMDVPANPARPKWWRALHWAGIVALSLVVGLVLGLALGPGLNTLWTETHPPVTSAASATGANLLLQPPPAPAAPAWALSATGQEMPQGMTAEAVREYKLHYLGAPDHKAFAISSGGVPVWYAGAASTNEASERALEHCREAHPGDDGCRVVDFDGNWQD